MIKLQQIKFQSSSSIALKGPKHLRISLKHIARNTTKPSSKPNQNSLIWSQPLYLPIIFTEQFQFQIYNHHSFGYNPEEIQEVYSGRISVANREQKSGAWQVRFGNREIGYLTAKISITPSVWSEYQKNNQTIKKVQELDSQPKMIKIKSIVASIPAIKSQQIWLQLKMGETVIKKIHKEKCSSFELVFLDQIEFYKPQSEYFLIFNLYIKHELEGHPRKFIGKAELLLPACSKKLHNEKVLLRCSTDPSADALGQIFVKFTSNLISLQKLSTMGIKGIISKYIKAPPQQKKPKIINPTLQSRNINFIESQLTKLENQTQTIRKQTFQSSFQRGSSEIFSNKIKTNSQPPLSSSRFSTPSPVKSQEQKQIKQTKEIKEIKQNHLKLISVVSTNKDVIFGQQQRFRSSKPYTEFKYRINRSLDFSSSALDQYPDSYLSPSLRQQSKRGRYYRGSSIGKGYKTDFTKIMQKTPGVGSYMLPTIWDRYK